MRRHTGLGCKQGKGKRRGGNGQARGKGSPAQIGLGKPFNGQQQHAPLTSKCQPSQPKEERVAACRTSTSRQAPPLTCFTLCASPSSHSCVVAVGLHSERRASIEDTPTATAEASEHAAARAVMRSIGRRNAEKGETTNHWLRSDFCCGPISPRFTVSGPPRHA